MTTWRQFLSLSLGLLLGLTSTNASMAELPQLPGQIETAILLNEDGTPHCRIGSAPELGTLRECEKGDERATFGTEEIHMSGVHPVMWIMGSVMGVLAFSVYKYLTSLSSKTSIGDHTIGSKYNVPAIWQWVNPRRGSRCAIQMGGQMSILGFTKNGTRALVEYRPPYGTSGTPCPYGTKFFFKLSQLGTMDTQYQNTIAYFEAIKNFGEQAMSGEGIQSAGGLSAGDTFQIQEHQWVEDLRILIMGQYERGRFLLDGRRMSVMEAFPNRCYVQQGGEVTILGFTESDEGRALVEYTFPGNTMGTPCNTGSIFFLDVSQLETL